MGKIIAIANQKGGVGKTSTAVNLSAAMAKMGKNILLVDLDPQGNSTSGLGLHKKDIEFSVYQFILGQKKFDEICLHTSYENLDILPSNIDLAALDLDLSTLQNRESKLKLALAPQRDKYDFIFIDCPPSLNLTTTNAICAAESVIIPVQCEYYALEGLSQLINILKIIKQKYNASLEIEGVLVTMFDSRLNLTQQVVREIKKYFGRKVFRSFIPRNVRISEAPSFGKPVIDYDKNSQGAQAYMALAVEVLKNNK